MIRPVTTQHSSTERERSPGRHMSAVRGSQVRVTPSFSIQAGLSYMHGRRRMCESVDQIDLAIEEVPCDAK